MNERLTDKSDVADVVSNLLAEHLAGSGMPTREDFPLIPEDSYLVCEYHEDESTGPRQALVGDYDEMVKWFNAARFDLADIDGWEVRKRPHYDQ